MSALTPADVTPELIARLDPDQPTMPRAISAPSTRSCRVRRSIASRSGSGGGGALFVSIIQVVGPSGDGGTSRAARCTSTSSRGFLVMVGTVAPSAG